MDYVQDDMYEKLINADEEEFVKMKRQEQAENLDQDNMSPYTKMSYFDRVKKTRKDREAEED